MLIPSQAELLSALLLEQYSHSNTEDGLERASLMLRVHSILPHQSNCKVFNPFSSFLLFSHPPSFLFSLLLSYFPFFFKAGSLLVQDLLKGTVT